MERLWGWSAWKRLARHVPRGVPIVSVAKGIETDTLLRPTQIIADILSRHGVRHLFALCGGHISPILTGAAERGIKVVDVCDEGNAVFAAGKRCECTLPSRFPGSRDGVSGMWQSAQACDSGG